MVQYISKAKAILSHFDTQTMHVNIPTSSSSLTREEAFKELHSVLSLSFPIALTELLVYSRFPLSMFFLGSLGPLPLAAGSLANAFAGITAYPVLLGLSLGMEPLCSQALGANQPKLLPLTLHRAVLFLLCCSLPIAFLWLHMSDILLFLGQDQEITTMAQTYIRYSLPDLATLSFIHPLRIYLQSQSITKPLTLAATFSISLHLLANLILVTTLGRGIHGVAVASVISNLAFLLFLVGYVRLITEVPTCWLQPTSECLAGWGPLVRLATPSCLSTSLEWGWYELVTLLSGILPSPRASVAAAGVLTETANLLNIFPSSLGSAASTRVGTELGATNPRGARASAAVSLVLSSAAGLVAAAVVAASRGGWGRVFTCDGETLGIISAAIPIVGLCEVGNGLQVVGSGVLRGSGRPSVGASANAVAFYAVGLPAAVGLAFGAGMGVGGLCVGLLAAQLCCAWLVVVLVLVTDWEGESRCAPALLAVGEGWEGEGIMEMVGDEEQLPDQVPCGEEEETSSLEGEEEVRLIGGEAICGLRH